jgi:hypothetical protein
MSEISVRLGWASNLTRAGRAALTELADVDRAVVSGAPNGRTETALNINTATADTLLKYGYAEQLESGDLAITRDGLIKIGRVTLTRSERRRQREAESLAAQASGDWKPAPAGESAASSRR